MGAKTFNNYKMRCSLGYNADGARSFINPGIPNVFTEYGSTIAKRRGNHGPCWGDYKHDENSKTTIGFLKITFLGSANALSVINEMNLPV